MNLKLLNNLFLRRVFGVSFSTALLLGGLVALGEVSFHTWLDKIFHSIPFGHALGTTLIVLSAFALQSILSVLFFRDPSLGVAKVGANEISECEARFKTAMDQVADELNSFPAFNSVVRSQLGGVATETEAAALNIMERLQAVDGLITELEQFVTQTSSESSQVLAKSESRLADNRRLIDSMQNHIQARIAATQQE